MSHQSSVISNQFSVGGSQSLTLDKVAQYALELTTEN